MSAKSLKSQYRDCYRLERLIRQSIALCDMASFDELCTELRTYNDPCRRAAIRTWDDARGDTGDVLVPPADFWAGFWEEYT